MDLHVLYSSLMLTLDVIFSLICYQNMLVPGPDIQASKTIN